MTSLLHPDVRTLLIVQVLQMALFAGCLLAVERQYQRVQVARRMEIAFALGSLGVAMLLARDQMALPLNVLLANGLLLAARLMAYQALCHFAHRKSHLRPLSVLVAISVVVMAFLATDPATLPARIGISAVVEIAIYAAMLYELLRNTNAWQGLERPWIACVGCAIVGNLIRTAAFYGEHRGSLLFLLGDHHRSTELFVNDTPTSLYVLGSVVYIGYLGVLSLLMLAREVTAEAERSARYDSLTATLNRRGIDEALEAEMERSRRMNGPLAVALLDIDNFKAINDTLGHAAGDECLRAVSACITGHLRPYDSCGRLGGDEFLLLLPGSDAHGATTVCERILDQVATLSGYGQTVTVSIGYTEYALGDTPHSLLARADTGLYAAKREGRNRARMNLSETGVVTPVPFDDPQQRLELL